MRLQAFIAAGCVLASNMSPSLVAAQDLYSFQESVSALQQAGVIDNGPIEHLRLQDGVNRAEALKVILKAQPKFASSLASIGASMPPLSLFPDVNQNAWYAPYVELGFRTHLIKGYPDGSLRPQNGVTVEEAAAMLTRALGENTDTIPFLTSADLQNREGQWYTGAISMLNAKNAILGESRLYPGKLLTRGDLFSMVARIRKGSDLIIPVTNVVPMQPSTQTFIGDATIPPAQETMIQEVQDPAALQYASGKPFAISIPSLGITDLTITHPEDAFTQKGVLAVLKDGVGHLFSYPGEGSKVMIYGHSSGYPWDLSKYTKVFRTINTIAIGSRLYVTYKGKVFVYQVTEKKAVPAKDRSLFEPDETGESLLLYTCWPPDSISGRYTVRAVPVEIIALR